MGMTRAVALATAVTGAAAAAVALSLWRRRRLDIAASEGDAAACQFPPRAGEPPLLAGASADDAAASGSGQPPAPTTPAPAPSADVGKVEQLVALASRKKQSGNEELAAGRFAAALELFEGALKALDYVVPATGGAVASEDAAYMRAIAEARVMQGACALNGALACLKLCEWQRAADLASNALATAAGDAETGGDLLRMGKALYRRAAALFSLGKLSEALEDLRRAAGAGAGMGSDVALLELLARVACARATALLHERQVGAAEAIYQEACDALDKLPADKGGGASAARAAVKAQVSYGLGECLAVRGAAKMAGRAFHLAAKSAARCESGGGKEGVGGGACATRQIWAGDMARLRLEALDRATRCLMAVGSLEEALALAQELSGAVSGCVAESSGHEGALQFPAGRAWARLAEVRLARAEGRFHQGRYREAEAEYSHRYWSHSVAVPVLDLVLLLTVLARLLA